MGGGGKRRGAGWSPAHPRLPLCSTVAQTHPDGPSWGWGPLGAAVGTWGPRSLRASLPSSDGRSEGQQTIACDREAVKTPDARPSSWNRGSAGRSAPSAQPAVSQGAPGRPGCERETASASGPPLCRRELPSGFAARSLGAPSAEWGPSSRRVPERGAGGVSRGGAGCHPRPDGLSSLSLPFLLLPPFPLPDSEKCFQPGRWEAFCPELTILKNARIPFRAGLWKPESLSFTTHSTRH